MFFFAILRVYFYANFMSAEAEEHDDGLDWDDLGIVDPEQELAVAGADTAEETDWAGTFISAETNQAVADTFVAPEKTLADKLLERGHDEEEAIALAELAEGIGGRSTAEVEKAREYLTQRALEQALRGVEDELDESGEEVPEALKEESRRLLKKLMGGV